MIYDFALEPELVATWHDRRVAYPVLCQMGPGHRRVPCLFPAAAWQGLVFGALKSSISDDGPAWQSAKKKIEVLVNHLRQVGTHRNGRLADGETWPSGAMREHAQFPFGGILVRASDVVHSSVVVADRLGHDDFPAWTPPAPAVLRRPNDLAAALTPVLRCARDVRFVDPYFDASDVSFLEPMKAYLLAAQQRRTLGDLRVQLHFLIRREDIEQAARIQQRPRLTEAEVARDRLASCERQLGTILRPGVALHAFAWGAASSGVRMHNRYVLTEVGGVAVQTGLDSASQGSPQTDDLTILSEEQHLTRWAEFSDRANVHRLIDSHQFVGARPGGG